MKKILFMLLSIQLLFSSPIQQLELDKIIKNRIEEKEKKYYKVTVPPNSILRVNLTDLEADIDLYVKKSNKVKLRFNDCHSSNTNTKDEECILLNKSNKYSEYNILVYGFEESSYLLQTSLSKKESINSIQAIQNVVNSNNNPFLVRAREHCLDNNESTEKVLCSNEPHIVYIITEETHPNGNVTNKFHKISINPSNEYVQLVREHTYIPWMTHVAIEKFFPKLAITTLYVIEKTQVGWAEVYGTLDFYNEETKVLTFQFHEDNAFFVTTHTFDNGQKLNLEYNHRLSNGDIEQYRKIYDISNPNAPLLLSTLLIGIIPL